jgi:uncharacterized OB-fold protein
MTALPVPEPARQAEVDGYWSALVDGQLTAAHCERCGHWFSYPRDRCPDCTSDAVVMTAIGGAGHVYSYTVNRRPAGPYREVDHLVLAYVELVEGPRVLTQIVDVDPAELRIGMPVTAVRVTGPSGAVLQRFTARREGENDGL